MSHIIVAKLVERLHTVGSYEIEGCHTFMDKVEELVRLYNERGGKGGSCVKNRIRRKHLFFELIHELYVMVRNSNSAIRGLELMLLNACLRSVEDIPSFNPLGIAMDSCVSVELEEVARVLRLGTSRLQFWTLDHPCNRYTDRLFGFGKDRLEDMNEADEIHNGIVLREEGWDGCVVATGSFLEDYGFDLVSCFTHGFGLWDTNMYATNVARYFVSSKFYFHDPRMTEYVISNGSADLRWTFYERVGFIG